MNYNNFYCYFQNHKLKLSKFSVTKTGDTLFYTALLVLQLNNNYIQSSFHRKTFLIIFSMFQVLNDMYVYIKASKLAAAAYFKHKFNIEQETSELK